MKKESLIRHIAILLALAVCCSCIPQEQPSGTGGVSLVFEASSFTRAVTPGDGTAANGGGIARTTADPDKPDLWVFLVSDDDDEIKARYPGSGMTDGQLHAGFSALRDTVSFQGLADGPYTVYAFANTEGLALTGSPDLGTVSDRDDLDDLLFAALGTTPGTDTISLLANRLPLAATAPLTVTENNNGSTTVEMVRCLAKITVEMINQTTETLSMPEHLGDPGLSITLHKMNPNQGYVFEHTPDIPLAAYDPGPSGDVEYVCNTTIAAGDTLKMVRYVFPSDTLRCGPFTTDVSFYLAGDDETYSYTDLPIIDYRARHLAQLARNTHLHLEIRVSRKKRVSFNFRVEEWNNVSSTVTFE